MVRIEAFIRPSKLDAVKAVIEEAGHSGISVTEIKGAGKQKGYTQHYRGLEYTVNLLPKVYISIVVKDDDWENLVEVIREAAATGEVGDGKIFVSPVLDAMRIRTGEQGDSALT
jgi:nitrogen regulatory protein P-II 1